jgi:hypothetical protein
LKLSVFDGARDNAPKVVECTWELVQEILGPHRYCYQDKLSVPAFSPAEYDPGARRASSNVRGLWLFVADVDHVTQDVALDVLGRVHRAGLAALAYSTWSHAGDPWRFRVVQPLSRRVEPAEWPGFWHRMNAAYGGVCDPKCVDPARLYFGPYAPTGAEAQNFRHVFDGDVLDVDAVLRAPLPAGVALQQPMVLVRLTRDAFERYAKQLKRKNNEALIEVGEQLLRVHRGEAFAESGERDNTIFRLAHFLGERFVDCDAASVAEVFQPSLVRMQQLAPDCPGIEDVAYKIARRQDEVRVARATKEKEEQTAIQRRISEAYRNGRSHPYTADELAGFGDVSKRWIIQVDRAYYFFFNGSYEGPYTEAAAHNAMARELSPASSAGVGLYVFTKEGQKFKSLKTLVDEYGTAGKGIELDLTAQKTTYDDKRRLVIEAPCPHRPITPKYHADIDRWLWVLCGGRELYYENLKTWLAIVTDLDKICAALFLTGKASVGKSMLPLGISRIWTTNGTTSLEAAFATFNDALLNCPLTLADETLPKDFRGHTKNPELRRLIQATEHTINRKFLPVAKARGSARVVVAAHDIRILRTLEDVSENETAGIVERYYHIETNPEAAVFLANMRPTTHELGWVDQDKIAEHVLWLKYNHQHQSQGRFYINVPDEEVMRMLTTSSGSKSAVCQWLVSFLLDPEPFHKSAYSQLYVRVKGKRLLANVRGLMSCWDVYVGKNEKCPSTSKLGSSLAELSVSDLRPKYMNKRQVPTNYHVIEVKNLLSWAHATGFASYEQIFAGLERETPDPDA